MPAKLTYVTSLLADLMELWCVHLPAGFARVVVAAAAAAEGMDADDGSDSETCSQSGQEDLQVDVI